MKLDLLRWLLALAIAGLPVFASISCSGEGGFGGASKKSSDTEDDDEDKTADEPVQIAGAFLACAEVTGGDSKSTGSVTEVGCGVYVKDQSGSTKKAAEGSDVKELKWSINGSAPVSSGDESSASASKSSGGFNLAPSSMLFQASSEPMHVRFTVPNSEIDASKITATLKDVGMGNFPRTLNKQLSGDLLDCKVSGWIDCAAGDNKCAGETMVPITSFPLTAKIIRGAVADAWHFSPKAFCNNGTPYSKANLDPAEQTMTDMFNNDPEKEDVDLVITGITGQTWDFSKPNYTFKAKVDGNYYESAAHFYEGCYFMTSGSPKTIYITSESAVSSFESQDSCYSVIDRLKAATR